MLKNLENSTNFAYADDTAIIVSHQNIQMATELMQQQLDITTKWCHDNGIVINAAKTKVMHVKPRHLIDSPIIIRYHNTECLHKQTQNPTTYIETCSTYIETVKVYKYLGIYVDNQFKWKEQIDDVRKKLRKTAYTLYHLSNCSTYCVLRQAYFSLAESYIRHGITAWGSAKYSKTLQTTQNQLIKILWKNYRKSPHIISENENIIYTLQTQNNANNNLNNINNVLQNNIPTNNHNANKYNTIYKELELLNVNSIYNTTKANDFFGHTRFLHNIDHPYNTRRRAQRRFKVDTFANEFGRSTLPVSLPKILNKLPVDVLNTTNTHRRKKLIKNFFISSQ